MAMENGLSPADVVALQKNDTCNDGFMGGSTWIFFLFFLLAWSGNGMGFGGNGGQALTRAELNEGFAINDLQRQIQGVNSGLCDGFYAQNTTMLNGFNGMQRDVNAGFSAINAAINQSRFDTQQCCCETNRNIDSLRFQSEKNTCDIITAGHQDTQRIIDTITQNEIQTLRDNLQSANLALQNNSQTASLISTLRPFPQPAYITCSPYTANGYCGC